VPEHLPEGLQGRCAQKAGAPGVVFENGAQELGDGEDEPGVTDLFEDASVESLGEEQDAFLLACGTEEPALTGICKHRPVAAVSAAKLGRAAIEVAACQELVHDLADDLAPGAALLLVAFVLDALELLVVVLDQGEEGAGVRVAGSIDPGQAGCPHPG